MLSHERYTRTQTLLTECMYIPPEIAIYIYWIFNVRVSVDRAHMSFDGARCLFEGASACDVFMSSHFVRGSVFAAVEQHVYSKDIRQVPVFTTI